MYDVAVVVPIYNTQDYLHRCVVSVLTQSKVNLQCILIDDGSTDNSADIARYYQRRDNRVTFVLKSNEGQGSARNLGIGIAQSQFIYFVDSDDYLGENALPILFEAAKKSHLDLCSPGVPSHYFEKPLEYIACLPNKSQFMRREILVKYDLRQPEARSGQDGVFSHLFLTHATRVGMDKAAQYNYTHAREGSTFQTYLKRSDLVADLLDQHYTAIFEHYERWRLWPKNAMRLLEFLVDETLKNRLLPHLPNMSDEHTVRCLKLVDHWAQMAARHLSKGQLDSLGPIQRLLLSGNADEIRKSLFSDKISKIQRKYDISRNTSRGSTLICKYLDSALAPVANEAEPRAVSKPDSAVDMTSRLDAISTLTKTLSSKLDLAINATFNSASQTRLTMFEQGIQPPSGNRIKAVISLTSLPARLPILPLALESIFSQSVIGEDVILWLPAAAGIEKLARKSLKKFCDAGLDLRFVEDVGPHTKLIYALREFHDLPIITLDDDMLYPYNTIQVLWEQYLRNRNAVIANWAREIAFDKNGKVLGVRSGKLLTPPLQEKRLEQDTAFVGTANMYAFPYGTCGVLYPPGSLSDQVFDVKLFRQLCPKEDDLWFKAMSLLAHTPVVVTNLGINPPHYSVVGSQFEALRHFNHGAKQNSEQFRAVFDHFDLYSIFDGLPESRPEKS